VHALPEAIVVAGILPRWVSDFGALTTALARSGYDVTLFRCAADPGMASGFRSAEAIEAAEQELEPGIEVRVLPYRNNRLRPVGAARTLVQALGVALRHPAALFVLWNPIPILLWGVVLRLLRRRVVYMVTGLGNTFSPGASKARRLVVEGIYGRTFADDRCRILVHNREDKAFLCERFRLPGSRVVVTPGCGVDPGAFPFTEGSRGTPPVILVPMRLLRDKGVPEAGAASKLLTDAGLDHEMWFTHSLDPSHPTSLTPADLARIVADAPGVRFLGYQESLVDLYRRADIVCVPTYYPEGLPTVLLEAASSGRPVVTCDNVGGRDFVRHGVDGLVVEPRSATALAAALERLLRDPVQADALRRSAHRRFLDGYTKADMLDSTSVALRDLGHDVDLAAAGVTVQARSAGQC
jgi:glycosyltransferase involved in cell wall biosynthesis